MRVRISTAAPGVLEREVIRSNGRPRSIPTRPLRSKSPRAFTLIELLVVIGIIGILASLLMPSLVRAKQQANKVKCLNHLRQVGLALTMYADDYRGEFPPRRPRADAWMVRLRPYFVETNILKCPSDSFRSDRSYVINGWNDYFESTLSPADYRTFQRWLWPEGMKQSAIPNPSETISFGEKKTNSRHVHMDFSQGRGNDVEQIEHGRHGGSGKGNSGGSNFAFVDNSVRFLPYGRSLSPVNLWAVMEQWRMAPAKLP